jgi:hypothetical protein
MSYIGNRPDTNILYYALGIDRFSGTGSQTAFVLSRELGQDLDAQVIVENVIQEPGASYAYSISGSTLTFTEAPPSGTNNIQVIFRTQNIVSPYTDVNEDQIGVGSITETKIATGAVTATKLATDAVTTAKIATGAVTSDELGSAAVIEAKIASGAVTADKIGAGAVTSSKIGSGAVGTSQLASGLTVNITGGSIQGITDIAVADGGTGASSAADARTNLGLTVANGYQIPQYGVMLWSGSVGSIPTGWLQCDGSNGTPNLPTYSGLVWIMKS